LERTDAPVEQVGAEKWDAILQGIARRVPEHSFRAWFLKISPQD